jgi:predicted phosphodiesterase
MRIAVIADIHSNLRALEAVLRALGSVDAIWQIGDVVGYGPDPDAVVARLTAAGAIGVRGNHDAAVVGDLGTGDFNDDARLAVEWTREHMNMKTRLYLAALPATLVPAGADFTLAHGSPRDPICEYLQTTWEATENLSAFTTTHCLVGHTHVPAILRQKRRMELAAAPPETRIELAGGRAFLNPGSVGQPRDGDSAASYMVLDTGAGEAVWHRARYDIMATQVDMVEAGLPERLATRLASGR